MLACAGINIEDGKAIVTMDIGFYIGMASRPVLESVVRFHVLFGWPEKCYKLHLLRSYWTEDSLGTCIITLFGA